MQISRRIALVLALALLSTLVHRGVYAEKSFIVVQSTTSTRDTGLFDYLQPKFTNNLGIEVRVVAVGTGQALKYAQNGDGDVFGPFPRRRGQAHWLLVLPEHIRESLVTGKRPTVT